MKKFKHVNPKDLLHQVYTVDGGVKEYNRNQQAIGALKFACAILAFVKLGSLIDKIENGNKSVKIGVMRNAFTMSRM